jgi:lipopolysaccharide/colanic/teichoic acid biosynthesis glycosyltransferase
MEYIWESKLLKTEIGAPARRVSVLLIVKRVIDLGIGIPLLLFAIPVILVMACLIRIDSPGNPFFKQQRVGRLARHFTLYKMRTLYTHQFGLFPNEEIGTENYRVSRVGKYLRRYKIDELPQLINILLGHMSFVGPRPDIPLQVQYYTADQAERLLVKPGLTGVTQISGNTLLSWPERIILDRWYIQHLTLGLDIRIMWYTFYAVWQGENLQSDPLKIRRKLLNN